MAKLPELDVPILPQWIAGRAYVSCGDQYLVISHAKNSEILLRQISFSGETEAESALAAAKAIAVKWNENLHRQELMLNIISKIAAQLHSSRYLRHFAKLLEEETDLDLLVAEEKIKQFIARLNSINNKSNIELSDQPKHFARVDTYTENSNILLVFATNQPFDDFIQILFLLYSGKLVIIIANNKSPALILALCELLSKFSCPAGVCNLLYGNQQIFNYFVDLGFKPNLLES